MNGSVSSAPRRIVRAGASGVDDGGGAALTAWARPPAVPWLKPTLSWTTSRTPNPTAHAAGTAPIRRPGGDGSGRRRSLRPGAGSCRRRPRPESGHAATDQRQGGQLPGDVDDTDDHEGDRGAEGTAREHGAAAPDGGDSHDGEGEQGRTDEAALRHHRRVRVGHHTWIGADGLVRRVDRRRRDPGQGRGPPGVRRSRPRHGLGLVGRLTGPGDARWPHHEHDRAERHHGERDDRNPLGAQTPRGARLGVPTRGSGGGDEHGGGGEGREVTRCRGDHRHSRHQSHDQGPPGRQPALPGDEQCADGECEHRPVALGRDRTRSA